MNINRDTPPVLGDVAGVDGTPDAVEAASSRRLRGLPINPSLATARGVEWVRPTDLVARGASRVAGAGIDFQRELARRTRAATSGHVRALGQRKRRLPPLSAFGRSGTDHGMDRDAVGMR